MQPPIHPSAPAVRTGQGSTQLSREEFAKRYQMQFFDPAFDPVKPEIERLTQIAWESYQDGGKSGRTRLAGPEFADPGQQLSEEWLQARLAIIEAAKTQADGESDARILVVCASPRTDETCPSEISKTFRIATAVCEQIENEPDFTIGFPRSESSGLGIRTKDFSVQGLCFHCDAAVSLAVFVLSEPPTRPDAGLDA
jgi:hypothetical protein